MVCNYMMLFLPGPRNTNKKGPCASISVVD